MRSTCFKSSGSRLLCGAAVLALSAFASHPGLAAKSPGGVYALSNQESGNSILVFHRDTDGVITPAGSVATGGNGAGTGADPLASQNPLILSKDGQMLFAVNAGSNSVTAFRVSGDQLVLVNTVPSGGMMPVSLAIQHHTLYALNAGGTPNISGFSIGRKNGKLKPLPGSTQPLPGGMSSAPAQISFVPGENVLVVTEKATNQIDTFVLDSSGAAQPGKAFPSIEATPFGFAFGRDNQAAIISNAEGGADGASTLSSFRVTNNGNLKDISVGVPDSQTGACWVAVTKDGHYAYTSNTGSGTVSSYTVGGDGSLTLLDKTAGTGSVPIDMATSHNSRFLYVRNAGDGTISGFRIRSDGSLKPVTTAGGLPDGATGLIAF
jgi:6-phosphogluconolactonase (cycloisomerase 2 family)